MSKNAPTIEDGVRGDALNAASLVAHQGQVDCRISSPDGRYPREKLNAIAAECAALLGENLMCYGHDSLAQVVADLLKAQGRWVRIEGKGWRKLHFALTPEQEAELAAMGLAVGDFDGSPQRQPVRIGLRTYKVREHDAKIFIDLSSAGGIGVQH